ncbi:hypothetical protein IQ244_11090 [Nostoc sp. LEGE 06077]|uniref:hypothetical protein n=1 Tax=Nostoc sp. LEGE 06077 TaxID=915325 RepID=UPI00187F0081|nr:hypothetical protein [Nostoc sp. LEGE 06077]MBE9207056.1 hypothetical protein [Nostoc sp. LEGE 06077]
MMAIFSTVVVLVGVCFWIYDVPRSGNLSHAEAHTSTSLSNQRRGEWEGVFSQSNFLTNRIDAVAASRRVGRKEEESYREIEMSLLLLF